METQPIKTIYIETLTECLYEDFSRTRTEQLRRANLGFLRPYHVEIAKILTEAEIMEAVGTATSRVLSERGEDPEDESESVF